MLEFEGKIITRFRTGSHSLAMELGRYRNIQQEYRLCEVGQAAQSIWHIFMDCHLTESIVERNYQNLKEIFDDEDVHTLLLKTTRKLKIRI